MSAQAGVDKKFIESVRRKNMLETKLFKMKYFKICKIIVGGLAQNNYFGLDRYTTSVMQENITDPKLDIPQNVEMFENVIKYSLPESEDSSGDEGGENDDLYFSIVKHLIKDENKD